MKRFLVWAMVGPALIFLAGCATTPSEPRPAIHDAETFASPFPSVWSALIATLAEQAYSIEVIEKESGLVTTKFMGFNRAGLTAQIDAVAVRPNEPLATWEEGRYTLSIYAAKTDSLTTTVKVTVYIQGFVTPFLTSTGRWENCYSKGVIEKRLFDAMKSKLK